MTCHPLILSHEAVHAVMHLGADLCIKIPESIYEGDFTINLGETFWLTAHFVSMAGDFVWVREDHKIIEYTDTVSILYRDGMVLRRFRVNFDEPQFSDAWRSPVAMPRAATRCVFKVVDIRIHTGAEGKLFWIVKPEPVVNVMEFLEELEREEWKNDE